jgi:hypothetical protein
VNTIRQEVRLEKFRKIKEAITTRDYVQKAASRINGELYWIFIEGWNMTPDKIEESRKTTPPALLEAIRDVKAPTGWRKNALRLIYQSDLKPLHLKSFRDGDGSFNFGKLLGISGDLEHELQKPDNDPELIEKFNDIVFPMLIRDEDIPRIEKGMETIKKAIEQVPTRSREEQKSYYSGLGEGTNSVLGQESERNYSTNIYYDLLMLGEYLECLPTRKQLFQFLAFWRGEKDIGKFSSFEKLCQNIEYLTPSQIRKNKKMQGKVRPCAF